MTHELPYLTTDFCGIGGTIKQRPEDFFVQELPLYEPCGEGEHVYCEVQKVGITTIDAVNRVARGLGVSSREIGYAGMKDAHAIARQVFSIRGTTEEAVMNLRLPDLAVQWAARHGNKLRLGHLRGNRFAIRIREVDPGDVVKLRPVLNLLERRGVPNYFGEQRFGRRGDNARLGAALVAGDDERLIRTLLGGPDPAVDNPRTLEARSAFDAGDYPRSMQAWPNSARLELTVLRRLMGNAPISGNAQDGSTAPSQSGRNPFQAAAKAIDQRLRRLWISALQSQLFNDVVVRRIESLDRLLDGDLACRHDSGACFLVDHAAAEQPRCDCFEISPTGPLLGYRITLPEGEPLTIERQVFNKAGLDMADFRQEGRLRVKGARRPLRFRPQETILSAGVDEHGPHITLAFTLPPGSFATVLLREMMKNDDAQRS